MKLFRMLAAASALSIVPQAAVGQAPPAVAQVPALSIERVFDSPSLNGPVPRLPKLSPDGRYLALLRNRPRGLQRFDLWAFGRQNAKWLMLVDSEKLGSAQAMSEAEKMQ